MPRSMRVVLAAGASVFALALPAAAGAAPNPSLVPPPGCTGNWNTIQAANNNMAPGTSVGCANAILHKK
jgi:hypothetical protein